MVSNGWLLYQQWVKANDAHNTDVPSWFDLDDTDHNTWELLAGLIDYHE